MSKWNILRIVNLIFWLWMWFSAALLSVKHAGGNALLDKVKQLFMLNPNLHHNPQIFVGNGIVIITFWFGMDWALRTKAKEEKLH